jgi:hypothetical protein
MKRFSIGDKFTIYGVEWTGRGFILDAAFEGWTLLAVNASGTEAQFTLREVESAIFNSVS